MKFKTPFIITVVTLTYIKTLSIEWEKQYGTMDYSMQH